ncbi:MAG TPA: glycoside hydrolase family 15 protein [Acidimicrobiales bacterium]|nr:glycoside hydrolase family 15 protein [Acidimicrobiales bacterium]
MALPLEEYGLIGDTHTGALVGTDGSIDWLCLPRFDSGACFAALLGDRMDGRWLLAPKGAGRATRRHYRDGTLILETEWDTPDGTVRVVDCMPPRSEEPDLVRVVEGVKGTVRMTFELVIRFDYGSIVPWVRRLDDGSLSAIGGPDALYLHTPVHTEGQGMTTVAEFEVTEGDRVPFVLVWHPSNEPPPPRPNGVAQVERTEQWWKAWSSKCEYPKDDQHREEVLSSLIVLKALTFAPTGGIVAAPTTSLPEQIGGPRNWDYRYCWLRDATFTLYALIQAGYTSEAVAWRDWLLRAVAGDPADLQIMYGPAGERRLPELELDWLGGYESSTPVRVGNAASRQFQLDVYGEVMDCLHQARRAGVEMARAAWDLQLALLDFLEGKWREPDDGIWEVRGGRRQFTHSKVMAWVAMDRAVKAVEKFGLEGPVDRWRAVRTEIHREVCDQGFDAGRNTFVQSYGSAHLDAALLMIPMVGFLPPKDPRVVGTIEAVERELCHGGFVMRYAHDEDTQSLDGLPPGEGAFLACTFWLADALAMVDRGDDAEALFDRLLGLRNDLGLLAEEYDTDRKRLVGNFPQALSHLSLVNTAFNMAGRSARGRPAAAYHRSSDPGENDV